MAGALVVYSTSAYSVGAKSVDTTFWYEFKKNVAILLLGGVVTYVVHRIPPKKFFILSVLAALSTLPMLVYLFFKAGGGGVDGAREIKIIGISFRPAHLAVISWVIITANYFVKIYNPKEVITLQWNEKKRVFSRMWLEYFIPLSFFLVLITKNNFSTGALCFVLTMGVAWLGGLTWEHLKRILALVALALSLYVSLSIICPSCLPSSRVHTWINRIVDMGDSKKTEGETQSDKATASIISGGFFGKGPGESNIKNDLAESQSDFVYATILEEYGIFGSIFIIFVFLRFAQRVMLIFNREENRIRKLIVLGLGSYIMLLAAINMGVSLGLMPVTGQPMPFFSFGGSFVLFSGICFGVILSISAEQQKLALQKADNQPENISEEQNPETELQQTQK